MTPEHRIAIDPEQLGRVERVDLRRVWTNEELDFTPWLQEHINELAERIGVELRDRGARSRGRSV